MNHTFYPHTEKRKFYVAQPGTHKPVTNPVPAKAVEKPATKGPTTAVLKASLLTLTIGGFSIGMTEFMMMGVLPDVASSLSISIPAAGNLISIYALGVVIGAPLMVALAGHFPPKKVLMSLMLLFALFNGLFALAPNYGTLLLARLFSGLPHGAFFGMGAVVASKLAEPGREARAVSMMFAGLTLANIIGVPLGTYIGHNFSWRFSFAIIAIVSMIAAGSIKKWLPYIAPSPNKGFKESLSVLQQKDFWLIIGISAIGTGGLFAWISYIAPLMTEVARFDANMMTAIMIIAGVGMAMGNFMGGRLADRYSPLKTTGLLLLTMVCVLLLVSLLAPFKVAALVMTFITGAVAFAVIAPMQMLMINAAKNAEMLASASLQASSNIGNALGAFLGGLPLIAGFGFTSPLYVGAGLALTGFVFCLVLAKQGTQKSTSLAGA
jgi:MFS transporter, DHA1 family, arabinose polymer utilization protein